MTLFWDVRQRRTLSAALNATLGQVSNVFVSTEGKTLVSVSLDGTLGRVWALIRGGLRLQGTIPIPAGDQVGSIAFSPGGWRLAVCGGTGFIRRPAPACRRGHENRRVHT